MSWCDNSRNVSDTLAREQLLTGILDFLGGQDLLSAAQIRPVLERTINQAGSNALVALNERLTSDRGWSYYPPDPLAASVHYQLADHFLESGSRVSGCEHLTMVCGEPVAIVSVTHAHRQTMMDVVGLMISELLPQRYRGIYARPDQFVNAAHAVRVARGV